MAEREELERLGDLAIAGRLTRVARPDGALYLTRKPAIAVRSVDIERRRVEVVASDATLDRYGDIIVADGWDLREYAKNPVVLRDHDYSMDAILGVAASSTVSDGRLVQAHEFDPPGTNASADMVWAKIAAGSARTVSVGFRSIKWEKILDEKQEWTGGFKFLATELMEVSWVAVPANPNATITGAGHQGAGLISFADEAPGLSQELLSRINDNLKAAEILTRLNSGGA